jgi:hypothetical protein
VTDRLIQIRTLIAIATEICPSDATRVALALSIVEEAVDRELAAERAREREQYPSDD